MKKKHKTALKHLFTLVMLALLLVSCLPLAFAAEQIQLEKPSRISIHYVHEKLPLPDVVFKIYRVGDVASEGDCESAGDFCSYPVKLNGLDVSAYPDVANTLYCYTVADGITPTRTGKTDAYGQLSFENLTTGLYLIVGEKTTLDGKQYRPIPVLVSLPSLDKDLDAWNYDLMLLPKSEVCSVSEEPQFESRRVIKVWDDWSNKAVKRPAGVIIQLLRDGQLYNTVTLSEANNWSYVWPKLDSRYTWIVVERDVAAEYTVLYTTSGTIFRVTNAYGGEYPPEEATTEAPTADGETDIKTTNPTSTPGGPNNPSLPQTGQMWWPVPVSAGVGLLFFSTGWFIVFRKRNHTDEE